MSTIPASKMCLMSNYELHILFDGHSKHVEGGMSANCTCTLLKSPTTKIIVDTRTPWDGEDLIAAIAQQNLDAKDINFCISTHGHSDHMGCNYLFKNAVHIVGKNCISKNDMYYSHDFSEPYVIDEDVQIIATPGHTTECITVLVTTQQGVVAIVGDLFEKEEDLHNQSLWKLSSEFPEVQERSRKFILEIADYIVPGHGVMFHNPYKQPEGQECIERHQSTSLQGKK